VKEVRPVPPLATLRAVEKVGAEEKLFAPDQELVSVKRVVEAAEAAVPVMLIPYVPEVILDE